jgi:hypothetical protein
MMIDVDWRQPFIDYLSEQKVPLQQERGRATRPPPSLTSSLETSFTSGAHLLEYS